MNNFIYLISFELKYTLKEQTLKDLLKSIDDHYSKFHKLTSKIYQMKISQTLKGKYL